nr:N-acetylmuramoyl-L-alanine amidase [Lysobacter bugurensis]
MLGAALIAGLAWNLTHAAEIRGVRVDAGATGTRAEITLDRSAEFKVLRLQSPDRLAVDLPESSLAKNLKLPSAAGIVQSVRSGAPAAGTVRIVFDLAQPVAALKPRIEPAGDGATLVLEWPGDGKTVAISSAVAAAAAISNQAVTATSGEPVPVPAPAVSAASSIDPARASSEATSRLISELMVRGAKPAEPARAADAVSSTTPDAKPASPEAGPATAPVASAAIGAASVAASPAAGSEATAAAQTAPTASPPPVPAVSSRAVRPLVIAIDPGHGGQDPGAIGLDGNREKDVTLAIARELARQINATPGLKAYLTRDADMFLPLPRRAQLARQAKADMFISIHADAAENRAAHGSSVYVLSTKGASSQRARWLADKENASDLIGGVRLAQASGTLASVLLDLTQSGHMKASEDAAAQVLAGLKRVGRNHKPSVERANFAVLRTSDMPAMLVETAFISNPEEEKRLVNPAHQKALAAAVLEGINGYFTRQPPPGTMYAMRAAAPTGAAGGSP